MMATPAENKPQRKMITIDAPSGSGAARWARRRNTNAAQAPQPNKVLASHMSVLPENTNCLLGVVLKGSHNYSCLFR